MDDWNELEKPFNEAFKAVQQSAKLLLIFCIVCFILGNHVFGLFKKKIENKALRIQKSEQLEQLNYFQKELELRNKRLKEIYTEQEKALGTEKSESLKDLQELYFLTESSLKVNQKNLEAIQRQMKEFKNNPTIVDFFKITVSKDKEIIKSRLKLFNQKTENEALQKKAALYCSLLIEQKQYKEKVSTLQKKIKELKTDRSQIEQKLSGKQKRRIKRIERRIQRTEEEKNSKEKEIESLKQEIEELNTKIDKNEELSINFQWFNLSINLKENVRYLPWSLTVVFLIFFFKAKDFLKLVLKKDFKDHQNYISLFSSEFIPQKNTFSLILRRSHYLLVPAVQIFLAIQFFKYNNKITNFSFSFIFHILIPCLICFAGILYWMFYERLLKQKKDN